MSYKYFCNSIRDIVYICISDNFICFFTRDILTNIYVFYFFLKDKDFIQSKVFFPTNLNKNLNLKEKIFHLNYLQIYN